MRARTAAPCVLKFGGTSVGTPRRRALLANLVAERAADGPVVVVTSALARVTDTLCQAIESAVHGRSITASCRRLARRHEVPAGDHAAAAIRGRLAELERLLRGVALLGACPDPTRATILAAGERLALPIVARALRGRGLGVHAVDGVEVLRQTTTGERPSIDWAVTRRRARRCLDAVPAGGVLLVPGFIAGDEQDRTVTLGRGASDTSATMLGRALDAKRVEIWTDTDGVLDADPRLVPHARTVPVLSYGEAAELARFGASVLHPEALAPVADVDIPVRVANTTRPRLAGTEIGGGAATASQIRALSTATGLTRVEIRAPWGWEAQPALAALDEGGIRPLLVEHGPSGRSLALTVPEAQANATAGVVQRRSNLVVRRRDGIAVVAVVGNRNGRAATAARMLAVLAESGVEPLAMSGIAAVDDDCSTDLDHAIAVTVPAEAARSTTLALHRVLVAPNLVETTAAGGVTSRRRGPSRAVGRPREAVA